MHATPASWNLAELDETAKRRSVLKKYKLALGLYVQQVNPKKQLVITGQLEKTPKGQVLGHPVQPVLLPEGTAQALDLTQRDQCVEEVAHAAQEFIGAGQFGGGERLRRGLRLAGGTGDDEVHAVDLAFR